MDYLGLAAAIASAIFWYRGSTMENISPVLWVMPSIGISGVVLFAMHLGWIAVLVGQIVLFIGIALYRVVVTDKDKA